MYLSVLGTHIILITFGEDNKLWSWTLSSFLQLHVLSSLFDPHILCTLFSDTHNWSQGWETKFTPIQNKGESQFYTLYWNIYYNHLMPWSWNTLIVATAIYKLVQMGRKCETFFIYTGNNINVKKGKKCNIYHNLLSSQINVMWQE